VSIMGTAAERTGSGYKRAFIDEVYRWDWKKF
jgi:hypothetical protein